MANINKVDLNLGQKIANPFKTTRKSATNPFKYSNFEGNTLQFADVFEGFEPKKINKLKMITSSVLGSMEKFRTSITEPIVNFVKRVREVLNTEIEIPGLKNIAGSLDNTKENIKTILNYDIGKGITDSLSGIGKNITGKLSFLNTDITTIGKDLSDKWANLVKTVNSNKISADTPVEELRELWIKEIELGSKEAA